MDFAIFWLPVIGGGVLWAIAISAWFSTDKQIPAVWFAFGGTICFLLTIALQVQLYVATFVAQPKIDLEGPVVPSHFRWELNAVPVFKGLNDQLMAGQSTSPRFKIRNTNSIFAADLSVEWTAPFFDAQQIKSSSAQLTKYIGNVTDAQFELRVPTATGTTWPITYGPSLRSTLSIPFLNRPVDTFLPIEVWSRAMILLLARLPDQPGNEVFDIEFRATVSWNIPDRGKPQVFLVVAQVRNTKRVGDTAIMDADVNFTVKQQ